MENLIINSIGWSGSLLLIIAYWLVSKKSIKPESSFYHSLNIGGSILLIVNTYYYGAFPSAAVNIVWVIIGTLYILKIKFASVTKS